MKTTGPADPGRHRGEGGLRSGGAVDESGGTGAPSVRATPKGSPWISDWRAGRGGHRRQPGIGLAIARGFVRGGARVVAGSQSLSQELTIWPPRAARRVVAVDLAGRSGPAEAGRGCRRPDRRAGQQRWSGGPRPDGFLEITDEMWQATPDTLDLMSAVRAIRAALPVMLAAGGGVIVNIGSLNARLPGPRGRGLLGRQGRPGQPGKSLSKEFGPRGIRSSTVHRARWPPISGSVSTGRGRAVRRPTGTSRGDRGSRGERAC